MNVLLTRPDGNAIHTSLDVRPTRYSHAAAGGPDTAELAVAGAGVGLTDVLTWLGCRVQICNDGGQPVWWGLVQAVTVSIDGVAYTLDAAQIVNRMAVLYTDADGNAAQTLWVEDAHSIAQYGRREVRESVRAESTATATAQATRLVNERSAPLRSVRAAPGPDGATVACVGLWRTLDWRYWSRDGGQIVQDDDPNTTELLGWAVAGTTLGFNRPLVRIASLGAVLAPLTAVDRVIATGSGSNSGTYEVVTPDDRTAVTTYTSNEIYFDTTDDVHDADGLLNQFRPGDLLEIADSTLNDGKYFLKDYFQNGDGGYDHMRVYPGTIADEAAGATVTITAGNAVEVTPRPAAYELPGATITLTAQATKVAQAFAVTAAAAWELSEVWLQAARIGTPTDNLQVEICANSSGAPGTVLKSATLTGADLPLVDAIDWQQWAFDHALMLAPATTYWLVVSRTGSANANAYRVGLMEAEEGLSTNNLLLWDGANWIARTVESALPARLGLRIFGQRLTTDQIVDVVTGVGDWLSSVSIRTASGLRTRLYRSEEEAQTALSEIKALLEFGTSGGARLLARVSVEGALIVEAAALASADVRYRWTRDGLRDVWGLPLAQGDLPVGQWVMFDMAGMAGTFAPAFLESAEFDVASGAVRPSFRAEQPVQTLARLANPAALPDLAVRLTPYLEARTGSTRPGYNYTSLPGLLVNDGGGADAINDMRVESDTEENMLFVDASADKAYIGGVTNGVQVAKGGHITLNGTARVWEDIRVEPSVRSSGVNVPAFSQWFTDGAGSRGVYLYTFDNAIANNQKEVFFTVQMPHAWAGTAIDVHVHWIAATTAASSKVRWGLEYTWAEPLATFGNTTLVYATDPEGGDTGTTQYKHMLTEFAALTPTVNQNGLSSILICRLWRDSANAADTYAGDAALLYIDAHFEIDKLGSNDEYS